MDNVNCQINRPNVCRINTDKQTDKPYIYIYVEELREI